MSAVKFDKIGGANGISIPCLPDTTVNGAHYGPTVCHCKGEYLCDMHRPAPPPPPAGACVLCQRIEPSADLIEGRNGMKWHPDCAR